MVSFSKFLTGIRGSDQLLDSEGYTYYRKKDKGTASGCSTWRCSKNRSKKCLSFVHFDPADNSLTKGPKEHNHFADPLIEEKKELISSLKRKAEDQQLSSTCILSFSNRSRIYTWNSTSYTCRTWNQKDIISSIKINRAQLSYLIKQNFDWAL